MIFNLYIIGNGLKYPTGLLFFTSNILKIFYVKIF